MTVAEARKLLAKLPDMQCFAYSIGETILEATQVELVPVSGDADGYCRAAVSASRDQRETT